MREWVRRRPFASFYLLAIAFPTLLFIYLIAMEVLAPDFYGPGVSVYGYFNRQMAQLLEQAPLLTQHRDGVLVYLTLYAMVPPGAPFLLFPFAPTVSALIVTSYGRGKQAARALLGAYRPWRGSLTTREGLRLYALLLLCILGFVSVVMLYDSLANGGARLGQFSRVWGLHAWPTFLAGWGAALFTNQGGLLEELGWRGYAWPLLARRLQRPLVAAAILGVAWALWHLPREIVPAVSGQLTPLSLLRDQALFITSCISMTIVAVTFVNYSGGSVWPAIMIHGTLNYLFLGFETGRTGVRSSFLVEPPLIWLTAALVVMAVVGPDLGWKRRMALHGGDGRTDPANQWALPAHS